MAQKQVSARDQVSGDALNAGFCLLSPEVHEDVAAEHHIYLGRERASVSEGEVVVADVHVASNELSDLIAAWNRGQIPPLAFGRQAAQLPVPVARNLGAREGTERHVGRNHLPVMTTGFIEEHRQAVRLLAVPASGAPHRVWCAACLTHDLRQCRELSGVPEEGAVLNGDSVQEIVERRGLAVEKVDVRRYRNARELRTFVEQPLEASTARRLFLDSRTRAHALRLVIDRIHAHLGVGASSGRTPLPGASAPVWRCGDAPAVRPNSRDTALSRPTSSKEVLTM